MNLNILQPEMLPSVRTSSTRRRTTLFDNRSGIQLENLLTQLKQRQIFKVATIYVVSAWPLIQIVDVAAPALGLPDSVLALLFKIFVVGFPISLIFAWITNFTPEGLVRVSADGENDAAEGSAYKVNMRAFAAVAGSLIIASILTLAAQLLITSEESLTVETAVPEAPAPENLLSTIDKPSIAVLSFDIFSSDPADEFFGDGMVEELLNLLAKIPDLQVAARTSSFAYKGVSDKTIPQIGAELGVDTILEGSIRKNDVSNTIRVTAQLIDVKTNNHFWSETYDREYTDIFQIQDSIARAVVDRMKATLLDDSPTVELVAGTTSVDAMVEYGKGQTELSHRTAPAIEAALVHFKSATEVDPDYASAYVGIADANILLALYGNLDRKDATEAAQIAIDKALSINSELGSAHASQGLLYHESHKGELAEESFKLAIQLNPSYAMAYMWYGSLMNKRGEIEKAHELYKKAFELDPKSPIAAFNVAWGHYQLGDENTAMDHFSTIIANDPYYPGAYLLVGDILRGRGRLDESVGMYQRALEVDPYSKSAIRGLLDANMTMQNIQAVDQWFEYLEQKPDVLNHTERTFLTAQYYAAQGKLAEATDYLKKVEFGPEEDKLSLFVEAMTGFFLQDYPAAIIGFEKLRSLQMGNEQLFFIMNDGAAALQLAYSYISTGQQKQADEMLAQYEKYLQDSVMKKANNPKYYYNMALLSALRDQDNATYSYLQGAIHSGWVEVWSAEIEPIFTKIRTQDRFAQMMGGVNAKLAIMRTRLQEKETQVAASD